MHVGGDAEESQHQAEKERKRTSPLRKPRHGEGDRGRTLDHGQSIRRQVDAYGVLGSSTALDIVSRRRGILVAISRVDQEKKRNSYTANHRCRHVRGVPTHQEQIDGTCLGSSTAHKGQGQQAGGAHVEGWI